MRLPFDRAAFLDVFARYNGAVWPLQVVVYVAAAVALLLVARRHRAGSAAMGALLSAMWLVNGAGYHLSFFAAINPVAKLAGALFILQGLLFAAATWRGALSFVQGGGAAPRIGVALIAYAMVLYAVAGSAAGHHFPRAPVFGVAPCPTTIFTFGVLLLATPRVPARLLAIPLLWSLVAASAALQLGMLEDLPLPLAGIGGTAVLLRRELRRSRERATHLAR